MLVSISKSFSLMYPSFLNQESLGNIVSLALLLFGRGKSTYFSATPLTQCLSLCCIPRFSLNTWPKWPPHLEHIISILFQFQKKCSTQHVSFMNFVENHVPYNIISLRLYSNPPFHTERIVCSCMQWPFHTTSEGRPTTPAVEFCFVWVNRVTTSSTRIITTFR